MADLPMLVGACSAVLEYGPCLHHRSDFTVVVYRREGPMGVGDCYQEWLASIDVATGETRDCVVDRTTCND